jgi:2-oxoglutarate dehydrogenase E2 component (dihydrolipoamide succinyltransferase)
MSEIKVPPLGESVTEATVGSWHKKQGEAVSADELLVELETDKITLEVTAEADGVLESISAQEGATVKVGDLLGSVKAGPASAKPMDNSKGEIKEEEAPKVESKDTQKGEKDNLSPATRKMAADKGIDTSKVEGSGKDGRVTKGDLLGSQSEPTSGAEIPAEDARGEERVKMSRLRQRIAERLKESQNTAAILTTFNEVDLTKVMNLRSRYKDEFVKKHNVKLGFMSFFVKAVVAALKDIPIVNAEISGDTIIYKKYYDIGVAVGSDKGLVVPVIRDADKLSFAGIEYEISMLAKKARDGKLSMQDLTGGTFSVTNGGIYGSMLSTPIINPPQSAILGMHNIIKRAMVVGDKIEIRPMMYIALSYDHRIIDGKEAVTFLSKIKEYVEDPELFCLVT